MDTLMDDKVLSKLQSVMVEILDEVVRICEAHHLQYFLIGGTLLGAVRHKGFIPWDDDLDIAMPRADYERFIQIAKTELSSFYEVDNFRTNENYYLNFTKVRKKGTLFIQDFQVDYPGPKGIWIDIFPLDCWKKEKSFFGDLRAKLVKLLRAIAHYKTGIFLGNKSFLVIGIKKTIGFLAKPFKTNKIMLLSDYLMKRYEKEQTDFYINLSSQYHFHKQTIRKDKFYPSIRLEFSGKKYQCPNDYDHVLRRIYGDYMKLPPKEKQITHQPIALEFDK